MRFEKVDDDSLVDLVHQGNLVAMEELLSRYKYYSWKVAYQFFNDYKCPGITLEELQQVAFSGFVPALRKFSDGQFAFYAYWKKIATNELLRYFLENSYSAKARTFAGISLDDDSGEEDFCLSEKHGEEDVGIRHGILKEELQLIFEMVLEKFKKEADVVVINLFIEGYTFEQIQKETAVAIRHIYYVVERFQTLFSKIMKKRNYN